MEPINDLNELLKHELKDLYSAETQLVDALPLMAEAASDAKLKKAFRDHLAVTKEHKKRLDKIQELLGEERISSDNKGFFAKLFGSEEGDTHCKAMEGLIKEANSLMKENMAPEVMDAALIAAAQKVEHYEISSYGTARAFALQLNMPDVAKILTSTLDEEYFADDSLTKLALNGINEEAEDEATRIITKKESILNNPERGAIESAQEKTPAKKTPAKKTAANKTPAKKPAPKKAPAKKSATTMPAKKVAAKKTPAKKAAAKKPAAKKSASAKRK
jgi:ferritin-like metal-binding protein YciE